MITEELTRRFSEVEAAVGKMKEGADAVRVTIENTGYDPLQESTKKID